jgi:hypothetical protein
MQSRNGYRVLRFANAQAVNMSLSGAEDLLRNKGAFAIFAVVKATTVNGFANIMYVSTPAGGIRAAFSYNNTNQLILHAKRLDSEASDSVVRNVPTIGTMQREHGTVNFLTGKGSIYRNGTRLGEEDTTLIPVPGNTQDSASQFVRLLSNMAGDVAFIGVRDTEFSVEETAFLLSYTEKYLAESPNQKLGLHVSQQLLDIWRQRAVSGPYKSDGDVSTRSPGDWNRIVTNAGLFKSNPTKWRWAGPTLFENVTVNGVNYPRAVKYGATTDVYDANEPTLVNSISGAEATGVQVLDAAFYLMVNYPNMTEADRIDYITKLTQYLEYQANIPTLQLGDDTTANRTKQANDSSFFIYWPNTRYRDVNPLFFVLNWMDTLLNIQDYLQIVLSWRGESLSSSLATTLQNWHTKAANYGVIENQDWDINRNFTDRMASSDNVLYTPTADLESGSTSKWLYADDIGLKNPLYRMALTTNNRRAVVYRYGVRVGLKYNIPDLVARGKRFVKDWLKYGVYADHTVGDYERWNQGHEMGFSYAGDVIGTVSNIAFHLAFAGDLELHTYKTALGYKGTASTSGNEKSILKTKQYMMELVKGTKVMYGTNTLTARGNATRVDTTDPYVNPADATAVASSSGYRTQHDLVLAVGNAVDKDQHVRTGYKRQGTLYPYFNSPDTVGRFSVYRADWGSMPAVLFMFGDIEDVFMVPGS